MRPFLLLLLAVSCHSLRTAVRLVRHPSVRCSADDASCALIELSTDDPVRLAKVLKTSWMEGGVKRGLTGTVLVPSANKVQIVASGQMSRLQSFADWLETSSMLVSGVEMLPSDECPTDAPLTAKFPLAPAAKSKAGDSEWFSLVTQATIDVEAAAGKTHSSDEGLV